MILCLHQEKLINLKNKIMRLKLIFFLVFFLFWENTFAQQKYPYVCNDLNCYNTRFDFVDEYYMTDTNFNPVENFSNYIDIKLYNDYVDYYQDDTHIIIEWFCTSTWCDELIDKELNFEELINIEDDSITIKIENKEKKEIKFKIDEIAKANKHIEI